MRKNYIYNLNFFMIKVNAFYTFIHDYNPVLQTEKFNNYVEIVITNDSNSDVVINEISIKTYFLFFPIKTKKILTKPFKLGRNKSHKLNILNSSEKSQRVCVNNKYYSNKFKKINL